MTFGAYFFPFLPQSSFSVTRMYARLAAFAFAFFLYRWLLQMGIDKEFIVNFLRHSPWIILGTWTLVIVTSAAIVYQVRETARTRSAEAVAKFRDLWESDRTRKARRRLALALIDGQTVDKITDVAIEDVVNLFEDLGTAVREGYLSPRAAYSMFFDDATHWWAAAGMDYAKKWRSEPPTPVYADFLWLVEELTRIEVQMTGKPSTSKNEDISKFLQAESRLDQPLELKSGDKV